MQQTEFFKESFRNQETPPEQLIHRWGSSISEIILDTSCQFFTVPDINGFIGYREVNQCAVALGEPICSPQDKTKLALAFHKFCIDKGLNSIYFIVSKPFAKWAIENVCNIMIELGEEVIFDPFIDPTVGHKGFKLRNRLHHAQNLGITVKEYQPFNEEIERSILEVGQEWVKARRGPQIYLGNLNFFDNRTDRRWFYLQSPEQKILGMALLTKLEIHEGWLLKFLITVPDVPRGTSELLMISILQTLRDEGCHYLTYGMIPADHLGEVIGLSKTKTWVAKKGFTIAKWLFHLDQRKTYWQKFHPKMEPAYFLLSNPHIGNKEVRALLSTTKMNF